MTATTQNTEESYTRKYVLERSRLHELACKLDGFDHVLEICLSMRTVEMKEPTGRQTVRLFKVLRVDGRVVQWLRIRDVLSVRRVQCIAIVQSAAVLTIEPRENGWLIKQMMVPYLRPSLG